MRLFHEDPDFEAFERLLTVGPENIHAAAIDAVGAR